ncbi:MAG TPA: LssY C-terminal domain-containing protein [Chthoniobacterales bacterium]|nr:LssY C-terminal domain-containing protein [Chthoniobacterales bacterium]
MNLRRPIPLILGILLGLVAIWLLGAYLLVPMCWKIFASRHKAITNGPRITTTSAGIHGDPLNLSFIGDENDLVSAMLAAGWYPADPITVKSSLRIAESTIFHRPYIDAPVSSLFLFGRKEDLAFEKPVGNDARQRHHDRFWQVAAQSDSGKPYWLGAITFDRNVGLSHTTGQITHHIAPDVDTERDGLIADLHRANRVSAVDWEDSFQDPPEGRNGGGDPWKTDGRLPVITLATAAVAPSPSAGK